MGCSNSTQVDEVDKLPVKAVDTSQPTTPSSASVTAPTLRPATAQQPLTTDTTTPTDGHAVVDEAIEQAQVRDSIPHSEPEPQQATMEVSSTALLGNTTGVPEPADAQPVEPNDKPSTGTTTAPEMAQCNICCEENLKSALLYPCKKCTNSACGKCLRKLFLTACTDESRMPPRCCVPLNVGAAAAALTTEEVTYFKDKHEEWATSNRVYCPIPTCSVFIPYRLFPPEWQPVSKEAKEEPSRKPQPAVPAESSSPPTVPPSTSTSSAVTVLQPRPIPCPKCAVHICCSCKQLAHPGSPCPEAVDDLDPGLAALLKKWNIKRCPKCRAAVRRMYGCSHMACRCGGQWCWHCNRQIDRCRAEGCPNEDDYDEESYVDEDEEGEARRNDPDRDLDAGRHWDNGRYFFGMEPNVAMRDPWSCIHDWRRATEADVRENVKYTCERCWTAICPQVFCYPEVQALFEHGSIPERQLDEAERGSDPAAVMVFCTQCSLTLCDKCHSSHAQARRR